MIGAMVRARVRARPVWADGRLAYGGYMELLYNPGRPYEVQLAEPGQDQSEVMFARDLLWSALAGEPDGEGVIRARLAILPPVQDALVVLTVREPDGPKEVALTGRAVAAFLRDTTDLVPRGHESRFLDLDAGLETILPGAA